MRHEAANSFGSLLAGRVVVVDTSSLLIAGTNLLTRLHDCELVIPAIVVQELEAKRSHPTLGVLARQWINLLEDLRRKFGIGLSKGVELDDYENITLRIEPNHSKQASLPIHLQTGEADSTILAVAVNLQQDRNVAKQVVLMSNDTPMRLHATLDLEMEAYEFSSSLLDQGHPYTGRVQVRLTNEEFVDLDLASGHDYSSLEAVLTDKLDEEVGAHTLVDVLLEKETTPVHTLRLENGKLSNIERKLGSSHIFGRTVEQDAALYYLKKPAEELPVVSVLGAAGTGKTLLTVATALEAVKNREYQKIVVFRSLHEMGAGQEMGFLPGGVEDKMGPWAGAIEDALDVVAEARKPAKKNDNEGAINSRKAIAEKLAEMIEVSPITYLRGRSLSKSFIILDEAQNFSLLELLNIISRVGEGSKVAILSDPYQVDNRFLQSGRKADIWSLIQSFKDRDVFAHVTLSKTERSRLAEIASAIIESNIQ